MFMDGLYYTTIARNIAIGDCSVWNLKFTNTVFIEFHEHPPLAMFLESLYFDVLGYNWFVDKLYSFSTYIFTAFAIHKLWKLLYPSYRISWLLVFFWLFTPVVYWAVANNMLENTMTIFILFSVYFLLKSTFQKQWYFILLAGICIALGFLTKGFVALFPISFYFIHFLVFRKFSFSSMIFKSFLLIASFLFPLLLLFLINPLALSAIQDYINVQVINSLNNIVTVESRFFIVKRLLSELLVVFILLALIYFFTRKKLANHAVDKSHKQWALFFSLFGLTGVLPIMISMKQSGYYILPSYPLLIIGLVSLFLNRLNYVHLKLVHLKHFNLAATILFVSGLVYALSSINSYGKDEKIVKDVEVISSFLKKGTIVNSSLNLLDDFSLHAYLYRNNFISIQCNDQLTSKYFLVNTEEPNNPDISDSYAIVPLKTNVLKLYTKK